MVIILFEKNVPAIDGEVMELGSGEGDLRRRRLLDCRLSYYRPAPDTGVIALLMRQPMQHASRRHPTVRYLFLYHSRDTVQLTMHRISEALRWMSSKFQSAAGESN